MHVGQGVCVAGLIEVAPGDACGAGVGDGIELESGAVAESDGAAAEAVGGAADGGAHGPAGDIDASAKGVVAGELDEAGAALVETAGERTADGVGDGVVVAEAGVGDGDGLRGTGSAGDGLVVAGIVEDDLLALIVETEIIGGRVPGSVDVAAPCLGGVDGFHAEIHGGARGIMHESVEQAAAGSGAEAQAGEGGGADGRAAVVDERIGARSGSAGDIDPGLAEGRDAGEGINGSRAGHGTEGEVDRGAGVEAQAAVDAAGALERAGVVDAEQAGAAGVQARARESERAAIHQRAAGIVVRSVRKGEVSGADFAHGHHAGNKAAEGRVCVAHADIHLAAGLGERAKGGVHRAAAAQRTDAADEAAGAQCGACGQRDRRADA